MAKGRIQFLLAEAMGRKCPDIRPHKSVAIAASAQTRVNRADEKLKTVAEPCQVLTAPMLIPREELGRPVWPIRPRRKGRMGGQF
jgi:hypothetical protein